VPARVTATHHPTGVEPPVVPPPAAVRPAPLALARAHLRLGLLALARTELEILAGEGALDPAGQVDLAEARWRSGDLPAAGVAASIALEGGEEGPVALAIAAEAAAALGRPNEARRLANRAMDRLDGPIDALFAGMPRSAVWPADADEPPPTAGTLFHHELAPEAKLRAGDTDPAVTAGRASAAEEDVERSPGSAPTLGFWDSDGTSPIRGNMLPDAAGELDAARAALMAGAVDEAVLRLSLVLRLAPALAPAVLEATDGIAGPAVSVVRGDAYRQVGLEAEARRAYAAAAWSGTRDRRGRAARRVRPRATAADPETSPPAVDASPPAADASPPADRA
jgi:hypothetical protein